MGRRNASPPKSNRRRPATDEELLAFHQAATTRKANRTREDILEVLERSNPHRMWRVRRDFAWMQKKVAKMGYSPDIARELL